MENLLSKLQNGEIDGSDLAKMVEIGEITKAERRKLQRSANKKPEPSERQKLRQETKLKKTQPKLTRY